MLLKAMMPLFKMAGKAVARFSIAIFKHLPDWLQLLTGPMMVKFMTKIDNICNLDLVNEKTMRELTDEFKKRGVDNPFELEAPNGIARVMKDPNGKVTMFKEGPDGEWIRNGEFDGVRVMKKGEHYYGDDGKWHGYGEEHLRKPRGDLGPDGIGTEPSRLDQLRGKFRLKDGMEGEKQVFSMIDETTASPDKIITEADGTKLYIKSYMVHDGATGQSWTDTFEVVYTETGSFQTVY